VHPRERHLGCSGCGAVREQRQRRYFIYRYGGNMQQHRIPNQMSFRYLGLLSMLLGGALAGCQIDDASPANDPLDDQDLSAQAQACTEFQGLEHCPLGNAKLAPGRDGATLDVTSMRKPGTDGVAILLPDSTEFDASGVRQSNSDSAMIWKAVSGGAVTSTMTVQNTDDGFTISGEFTGNKPSTYDAILYRAGEVVGRVSGLNSGVDTLKARWSQRQLRVIVIRIKFVVIIIIIRANEQQQAGTEGACVWDMPLGQDAVTTLRDGKEVTFDRVELVENVLKGGSYPYLTFDRIDYTSNDESLQINREATK